MQYAYLFEARGIQRFLFASGKLRDMLGGSELVDFICAEGGYLDQVLQTLSLKPGVPRRAGGSFYLAFANRSEAIRFRDAWRLASAQWLPGLERVDALGQGEKVRDAIADGLRQLQHRRNVVNPDLPRPGPLSERSPRTGQAAICRDQGESLDAATAAMRRFERPDGSPSLTRRFLDRQDVTWPVNFEENSPEHLRFPLRERRLVGLVHADGNGLGELLRTLNLACANANDQTYIDLYRCFSNGVSRATLAAAAEATQTALLPHLQKGVVPARPLVLGGDDLSVIVRADLAVPFTEQYLRAFEKHSAQSMSELREAFRKAGLEQAGADLPEYLTACAGITYMKCSQPFHSAYELAEGLCSRAKKASREKQESGKPIPSSVSFLKITDSLLSDIETMIDQSLLAKHYPVKDGKAAEREDWCLSLTAYGVGETKDMPSLSTLLDLSRAFTAGEEKRRLNDRPLRELATLMHASLPHARQSYARWRQVSDRLAPAALQDYDRLLRRLAGETVGNLPFGGVSADAGKTLKYAGPLADLLTLLTVTPMEERA